MHKFNRRRMGRLPQLVLPLLLLSLLVVLAACGGQDPAESSDAGPAAESAPPAENTPGELTPLRVGYVNVMDDAQVMLAEDAGLFETHGLDVELQVFGSGTDLIKGIVSGQLDAGVLGFTNAVNWAAQGADLKVVGGAQIGYHSILVPEGSGIETVADLRGKTLASQKQGSTADIVLNGVTFKEAGLTRQDVNMEYVSPAVAIQSLAAGQVDAAFVFEPYDRIARYTSGAESIYEIGQVWPFPCMVVITSGEAWNEKGDAIRSMLDAQREAIETLEERPGEAAELIAHRFIADETLETPEGTIPATHVIEEAIAGQTFNWEITPDQVTRMKEIVDLMVEQGVLETPVDIDEILDLSWQEGQG